MHQATWGRYSRERERVREERAGSPDHLGTVQQREREGEGGESRLTRPPGDGTAERGVREERAGAPGHMGTVQQREREGEGGESRLTRPPGDGTAERERG